MSVSSFFKRLLRAGSPLTKREDSTQKGIDKSIPEKLREEASPLQGIPQRETEKSADAPAYHAAGRPEQQRKYAEIKTPSSKPEKPSPAGVTGERWKTKEKEKKFVNVGIDFGTSSTKVIYRDQILRKAWIQTFDLNLKQYPPVVYPSVLRIIDGKVYFGASAEKTGGGITFRSFKTCVACQNGRILPDTCNLFYDKSVHPEPSIFSVSVNSSRLNISASELSTYYLANVIGLAKKAVFDRFSNDFDVNLTLNMCMPVDYQEHSETSHAFQRALFLADSLSDKARNGVDLGNLHHSYRQLVATREELPSEAIRRTFVQPESISAVMSYAISRSADQGLYAIVDVGAGTTDVTFFRLADMPERTLAVYRAMSHNVGGNEIDSSLLKYLLDAGEIPKNTMERHRDELSQRIKVFKERINPEKSFRIKTNKGILEIEYNEFRNLVLPVVKDIFSRYRQTFGMAYEKEKLESRWWEYFLFPIGGCSKVQIVRRALEAKPWDRIDTIKTLQLPIPKDLYMDNGEDNKIRDYYYLLTVAYGLSFHPAEYPEIILPPDVDPLAPSKRVKDQDHTAPWGPVYPDTK